MQGVYQCHWLCSLAVLKYSHEYSGTQIQRIKSVACRLRNLFRVTVHSPHFKTVTCYSDSFFVVQV